MSEILCLTHTYVSVQMYIILHRPNRAGFKMYGLSSPDFNI